MAADVAGFSARFMEGVFMQERGNGQPLLLLHGFPQTGLMWRDLAPILATDFRVISADMPGYGHSAVPAGIDQPETMSKRNMAAMLVEAMRALGAEQFAVAGHDRGGRVAYRMAFDYPDVVTKVAVLDVLPTYEVWARADARLALGFWPFGLLAQPAPLPERLIGACPDAVIDDALANWGSPPETFPSEIRAAYVEALRDPAHVHAICQEYRAAASVDRDHDAADLKAGRKIAAPLLALWSGEGALAKWYEDAGGPLGLWRRWAQDVRGQAMQGGHFFPEEHPQETAWMLRDFFAPPNAHQGERLGRAR